MRRYILSRLFLPVILAALVAGCATSQGVKKSSAGSKAVITGIRLKDNSLTITSNRHFTFTVYSTDDPYKITVDIPDMSIGRFTRKIVSEKEGFTAIIPRQTTRPDRAAKIDIMLQSPGNVVPFYKDNALTIRVKSEEPVSAGAEQASVHTAEAGKPKMESAGKNKSAVDRGSSGMSVSEAKKADKDKKNQLAGSAQDAQGKHPEGNPEKSAEGNKKVAGNVAPLPKATEITGVSLDRSAGSLKVVIKGNGTMTPNVFPLDRRIVIDVPGVTMHASLPESVILPLTGIRSGRHKDKIRLVLDLKKKTKFEVAAVGDSIEISLKKKEAVAPSSESSESAGSVSAAVQAPSAPTPAPVEPEKGKQEAAKAAGDGGIMSPTGVEVPVAGKYTGKKISLDFQDADIGPIFRLLADVNGYNLVLDPSVHGKITIKLMNVPWDQALDIILNTFNLGKSIEGNILWIAPNAVFTKIINEKKKTEHLQESAEELTQAIIRINYSSASAIQAAISNGKLLSPRGSITIDSRMNTLIIKDTQRSIDKIKDLVKIMDVAKPQVMIEAKIVQVTNDYNQTLGISWGGSFTSQTFPNVVDGNFSVNTPTVTAGPGTNNPGGALGMTIGHANTAQLSLSLQALETVGKAKTLSNPKILTMDNEAATIQQGKTFFIPTVSQSGTQTQQEQATLSLKVTPKITPDGFIQLQVNATDNSLEPGTAGASAVVDTKSIKTQALVANGQTLVLGGIYTTTETESEDRVPLLGQIPVIGWLFKTRDKVGPSVSELLIFITPKIIKSST